MFRVSPRATSGRSRLWITVVRGLALRQERFAKLSAIAEAAVQRSGDEGVRSRMLDAEVAKLKEVIAATLHRRLMIAS